ncbi:hypothetical protein A8U91_00486 [Halomonas elongata]|uniref:Uncharacterized protein n=1 Tax=Halomonas elongata TaxID=2746 RepID=A0A1B8P1Q2_HALEL|nr:hypothetical protein [Halomonas elongata]OBX36149.1 hypothetical protein A8U91_00486 [Halomonas elongata]
MASAEITQENFAALLEDMRAHAKNCIQKEKYELYKPSNHTQDYYDKYSTFSAESDEPNDSEQKDFNDVVSEIKPLTKDNTKNFVDSAHSDINSITEDYKNESKGNEEKAKNDFTNRMNKSREEAKKKANDAIDKAYDTALKLGKNLPPKVQGMIVSFMDGIAQGILTIVHEIVNFIANAVDSLVTWIKDAFNTIKKTFQRIGDFITGLFG